MSDVSICFYRSWSRRSRSKRRSFVSTNSLQRKFKITIILILGAMNYIFPIIFIVAWKETIESRRTLGAVIKTNNASFHRSCIGHRISFQSNCKLYIFTCTSTTPLDLAIPTSGHCIVQIVASTLHNQGKLQLNWSWIHQSLSMYTRHDITMYCVKKISHDITKYCVKKNKPWCYNVLCTIHDVTMYCVHAMMLQCIVYRPWCYNVLCTSHDVTMYCVQDMMLQCIVCKPWCYNVLCTSHDVTMYCVKK